MLLILVIGTSCTDDAPRDNPFDPHSEVYRYSGAISGTVRYKSPPYHPTQGVRVTLDTLQVYTTTDQHGRFTIENIPGDAVTLRLEKQGFQSVSRTVPVPATDLEFVMNARPRFESANILTVHQSHWWPVEDEYQIQLFGFVSDLDGLADIDSIWFSAPDDSIFIPIDTPVSREGVVEGTLYDWEINQPLTDLAGRMFYCHAMDGDSAFATPFPVHISRFIEDTPVPLEPVSDSQTGAFPTLRWDYFDASYTFNYIVKIYRLTSGNTAVLVFEERDLTRSNTQITLSDSLPQGSYYWTLGVVDTYGNSSHSKEATFSVTG